MWFRKKPWDGKTSIRAGLVVVALFIAMEALFVLLALSALEYLVR